MRLPTTWTRGGLTAIAGIILIVIGLLAEIVGSVGLSSRLFDTLVLTWNAMPPAAILAVYSLSGLAIGLAVVGVLMIGFARPERDQEEESLLDPTRYPRGRLGLRTSLPLMVLIVGFLVFVTLSSVPIAHAFSATIPVGVCGENPASDTVSVTLPSGAVLSYSWQTSNGLPVTQMAAPNEPNVTSFWPGPAEYLNSSGGSGLVNSGGYAVSFSACDMAGRAGTGLAQYVYITGTYYNTMIVI